VTLLVDDELLLLEALWDFLEIKRPWKVLMASSIDEAFAIFLKERDTIWLLVTDLRILNTSWVELIKNIRDIEPSIPCVLMSGDEQMAREAIWDIKNIVIQRKPFSGKNLNELVEGILK
jgi:DNA-binding NtrC family response regulator